MKTSRSVIPYILLFLLASGITLASLGYLQPAECQSICDDPVQAPCPPGSCRIGEQRAGFPVPYVFDRGGSSPTGGWGKVGPEDMPNPLAFLMNVAVYAALLKFAWEGLMVLKRKKRPQALFAYAPWAVVALAVMLYSFMSNASDPVKVDYSTPQSAILGNWTSTDTGTGSDFIIRFYDNKQWSILIPDRERSRYGGEYSWTLDGRLRIAFHGTSSPPSISDICTNMLDFLKEFCKTKVVDPNTYPEPAVPVNLAYPVPTRELIEFVSVEGELEVDITQDKMTLVPPSGTPLIFQRMIGN